MMKRVFDILISLMTIIIFIPIGLVVTVVLICIPGHPVFFKQRRPGLNAIPFDLYKFSSMSNAVDSQGELLPDAQRLTNFGKIIRSLSIDELPQLWNVLKGNMSLVGPRPLLMEYLPLYSETQARRHEVKPGITGWAQVNGRNAISWQEKFELDIWYVENRSVNLDCKIMWLTFMRLFKRNGISAKGHATMERFKGDSE